MHLIVGIAVLAIFVVFTGVGDLTRVLAVSAALLVGSLIPDLDHPFSHVRQLFRLASFIVLAIIIFMFMTTPAPSTTVKSYCVNYGCSSYVLLVQALLAVVASFVIVMIIDFFIPFHRGPLHGITAAGAYAIVCWMVSANYSADYVLIALAGFVGYLAHIIPDMIFKI